MNADKSVWARRVIAPIVRQLRQGVTPEKLAERYSQDVVVYGHTHRQLLSRLGNQLVINPGAAGQQRFKLLPTVARLTIEDGKAEVEIVALD